MNKILKIMGLGLLVTAFSACTKEETIIQEYNPPQPTLYGTWKQILGNNDPNHYYLVYLNDNENLQYNLFEDQYGFRQRSWTVYKASDKQIQMGGTIYNYTVKNDTLTMVNNAYEKYTYLRVSNPGFTPANWVKTFSIIRKAEAPYGTGNIEQKPFGIDGDFLYVNGLDMQNWTVKVYKFNTLTGVKVDSTNALPSTASTYFKSGSVYYGYSESSTYIMKGSMAPANQVSNNQLPAISGLSMNLSTGTIFAFTYSGKLYAGSDGSTFSELFDFTKYSMNTLVYYKDDQFLCMKNGRIYLVKISPGFTITAQYDFMPGFSLSTISTNGTDIWVYGWDNTTSKNTFAKIMLN